MHQIKPWLQVMPKALADKQMKSLYEHVSRKKNCMFMYTHMRFSNIHKKNLQD